MTNERDAYTAEQVRRMLDYDPKTGILTWRHRSEHPRRWNSRYAGKPAGTKGKTGYVYIELRSGLPASAARIAWLIVTGAWPERMIDHRNGVRDDNRWENLRLADNSQNSTNKAKQRNNASGFVGVHFNRQNGKWRACVNLRRVRHDVGFFATAEEAAKARESYVKEHQGEFAPTDPERKRYEHHRDRAKDK